MKNRVYAFILAVLLAAAGLTMTQNTVSAEWHEDLGLWGGVSSTYP